MQAVIRRGTPLPVGRQRFELRTTRHGQTRMSVDVYEGERRAAARNYLLATFTVENIPPGEARSQAVVLWLSITENGILSVTYSCEGDPDLRQIPVQKNPWNYTREELNQIVPVDAKLQEADEQSADEKERRWRRKSFANAFIAFAEKPKWRECGGRAERHALAREVRGLSARPTWEELFLVRDRVRDFWTAHGHTLRFWMVWDNPAVCYP
jgi:molecular chaperone DnaK (HSP70)